MPENQQNLSAHFYSDDEGYKYGINQNLNIITLSEPTPEGLLISTRNGQDMMGPFIQAEIEMPEPGTRMVYRPNPGGYYTFSRMEDIHGLSIGNIRPTPKLDLSNYPGIGLEIVYEEISPFPLSPEHLQLEPQRYTAEDGPCVVKATARDGRVFRYWINAIEKDGIIAMKIDCPTLGVSKSFELSSTLPPAIVDALTAGNYRDLLSVKPVDIIKIGQTPPNPIYQLDNPDSEHLV